MSCGRCQPLLDRFGLDALLVVTLQAISGAGYPGVSALDIVDNVVPFVSGEEPKLELEPLKILGGLTADRTAFQPAAFPISAHCNRVATVDGHVECVSVKLSKPATTEEVVEALSQYTSEAQTLKLPSAPKQVTTLAHQPTSAICRLMDVPACIAALHSLTCSTRPCRLVCCVRRNSRSLCCPEKRARSPSSTGTPATSTHRSTQRKAQSLANTAPPAGTSLTARSDRSVLSLSAELCVA